LDAGELLEVSSYTLTGPAELDGLLLWLDGVLATATHLTPTPAEITRRLGAGSPAFALDIADLRALYDRHRGQPGVVMKRSLWAKLLSTALGTAFVDQDSLFIEHTLLVVTAEIIGHAVVGFDPADPQLGPATLVRGQLFAAAQIRGVVEEDFFDWVIEVEGGPAFVRTLARRLARFAWGAVEHDVMKVLYESVIGAETRKSLGEYYTPDWLAEAIVEHAVNDPLNQRVLDPSCGSGTFVFHAVRRYLHAAAAAGHSPGQAISGVTQRVLGVDVHPVAVTLARVTYLLAIGRDRLMATDRPTFSVPVYLGDSVQWGQNPDLLASDALVVPTGDGATLFADELRFPHRVVEDAGRFDALVADLADAAARPDRPGQRRRAAGRVPALRRPRRGPAGCLRDLSGAVRAARRRAQPHLGVLPAQPGPAAVAVPARQPRRCARRQPAVAVLPVHGHRNEDRVPGNEHRSGVLGGRSSSDQPGPVRAVRRPRR